MDDKNKKSLAAKCGYILGAVSAVCITALIIAVLLAITTKIILLILGITL